MTWKFGPMIPDKAAKLERRVALEGRLQTHDTALIAAWESEGAARSDDGEAGELAEIRARVEVGKYVMAAVERRGLNGGPELEYNAAMGVAGDGFPMSLLDVPAEERAAITGEPQVSQGTWLDRVFGDSAAAACRGDFPQRGTGHRIRTGNHGRRNGRSARKPASGGQRDVHRRNHRVEAETERGPHDFQHSGFDASPRPGRCHNPAT